MMVPFCFLAATGSAPMLSIEQQSEPSGAVCLSFTYYLNEGSWAAILRLPCIRILLCTYLRLKYNEPLMLELGTDVLAGSSEQYDLDSLLLSFTKQALCFLLPIRR